MIDARTIITAIGSLPEARPASGGALTGRSLVWRDQVLKAIHDAVAVPTITPQPTDKMADHLDGIATLIERRDADTILQTTTRPLREAAAILRGGVGGSITPADQEER